MLVWDRFRTRKQVTKGNVIRAESLLHISLDSKLFFEKLHKSNLFPCEHLCLEEREREQLNYCSVSRRDPRSPEMGWISHFSKPFLSLHFREIFHSRNRSLSNSAWHILNTRSMPLWLLLLEKSMGSGGERERERERGRETIGVFPLLWALLSSFLNWRWEYLRDY